MVTAHTASEPMVTCCVCRAQFPMSGSPTQGHGCACQVYQHNGKWFIRGHYGSRLHDMNTYEVVQGPPLVLTNMPTRPMDPVCDVCVEEWLRCKIIVMAEENTL